MIWQGKDVELYEKLKQQAVSMDKHVPQLIKEIIEREISRDS